MPNDLINNDPMVSQNFFLEIDGEVVTMLSGASGLDVEVDVATIQQAGKGGMSQTIKTVASRNKAGDLSLTRMAPLDATADEIWKWFKAIREGGLKIADRAAGRKNGSVVVYGSDKAEVARFNFFNGWPSKIATDGLSVDSNDPVKETITLVIERLERAK